MNQKKDDLDMVIQNELKKEGQEIKEEYESSGSSKMPDGLKNDIRAKLHSQIEEYELEQLYAKLPERDREALKLGREMLEQKKDAEETKKVVYRKKRRRLYISVATVAVLVLALGMTSFGGAERIIEIMKRAVGDREVIQVDSNEENKVIEIEKEEEAYQKVKDAFGVEPVKIVDHSSKKRFKSAEINDVIQTAEFLYKYQEENMIYIISATFATTSFGIDVEDEVTDQYVMDIKEHKIDIKEYQTPETKINRYSARFSHKGLEYFLMGTMEKQEFEEIIKSLYFFN